MTNIEFDEVKKVCGQCFYINRLLIVEDNSKIFKFQEVKIDYEAEKGERK
jgi:hypothetical protein